MKSRNYREPSNCGQRRAAKILFLRIAEGEILVHNSRCIAPEGLALSLYSRESANDMFITGGVYHFRPKRLAFRNDYCLACQHSRPSVQVRTLDVVHIFWIPILPLGIWKRWLCDTCGRETNVEIRTRRSFKWAGLVVLLLLAVISWAAPVEPDSRIMIWVLRIGGSLGALLTLVYLLRTPRDPSWKERIKLIAPATTTICPFCSTPLMTMNDQCTCPACGVVRL
jgi:hypothetical protein